MTGLTTRQRTAITNQVQCAFEEEYRWLNPPPAREDFRRQRDDTEDGPWMGRPWTIAFIVVASIIISGLRTASLFAALANHANAPAIQLIEGLAAVALVELGIVLTGFRAEKLRQEQLHKPRHVANLRDLARGVRVRLGMAAPHTHAERSDPSIIPPLHNALFLAALVANIWVSVQVALADIPNITTLSVGEFVRVLPGQPVEALAQLVIAFIVGAVPPVAAKAAGEAAARDLFRSHESVDRAEAAYKEAFAAWQEGLRRAWETDGLARLEAELDVQDERLNAPALVEPRSPAVHQTEPATTDRSMNVQDLSPDVRKKLDEVAQLFAEHPGLSISDLANLLEVSKSTAHGRARQAAVYGLLIQDAQGRYHAVENPNGRVPEAQL